MRSHVNDMSNEEYDTIFISRTDNYAGSDNHGLFQVFKYFQKTLKRDCAYLCTEAAIFERENLFNVSQILPASLVNPRFRYSVLHSHGHEETDPLHTQPYIDEIDITKLPKHKNIIVADKSDLDFRLAAKIMEHFDSQLIIYGLVHNTHTGLCSYPEEARCDKYKFESGCYNCEFVHQLKADPSAGPIGANFPEIQFEEMRKFLSLDLVKNSDRVKICLPATYAKRQSQSSFLLKELPHYVVPLKNVGSSGLPDNEFLKLKREKKKKILKGLRSATGQKLKNICVWSGYDPLLPRKGFKYYMDTLHLLEKKYLSEEQIQETAFYLIGNPEDFKKCSAFLPKKLQVFAAGLLKQEGVSDALLAADVYACTTLEDAMPRTIPEAAAHGTPTVSFDRCIAWDFVDDESGAIVETYDVDTFAAALSGILTLNTRSLNKFKLKSRENFNKFNDDARINSVWEEVLGTP